MSKKAKIIDENKKYRIVAYIFLSLLILLTSFISYKIYRKSQIKKYSQIIIQSVEDIEKGNQEEAIKNLEKITKGNAPATTKSLANLNYAQILYNKGDIKSATDIYKEIAECNVCNKFITELGQLLYIKTKPQIDKDLDADKFVEYIDSAISKSKFLTIHLLEQKGIFCFNNYRYDEASEVLIKVVKSEEVGDNIKQRAKDILVKITNKRKKSEIDVDKIEREEIETKKEPLKYKSKDSYGKQNYDEVGKDNEKDKK